MKKPKRGERYLNHLGEYCIIKSIYRDVIKIQICGDKPRTEPWKMEDFLKQSDRFWIVPFPKINRTNVAQHLLEYQLNLTGKTTANTVDVPDWFNTWTITHSDYMLLNFYAIHLLKKVFRFNSYKARETFNWWYMHFGLKKTKK